MQSLIQHARSLAAPQPRAHAGQEGQATQQEPAPAQVVKLIYGDVGRETLGHVISADNDFLRFRELATNNILNTPWSKVDSIVEINQ